MIYKTHLHFTVRAVAMLSVTALDFIAGLIFFGAFVAALVAEAACGPDSENCPVVWGNAAVNWQPHCAVDQPEGGLADPALSVGSLQFAAALPYLAQRPRSALPVVATYLGVSSFLFHAHGTSLNHRFDLTGVVLLTPAVFDALISLSSEFKPEWRIGLLGIPILLVATIYPSGALVYSVAGAYAAFSVGALYANRSMVSVPLLASVCLLLLGVVLILVGNAEPYWTCIPSQAGEPHFWGHFFAAAGAVGISRRWSRPQDARYTALATTKARQ